MTIRDKTAVKPVAKLDASLLLARKGQAQPAQAATVHNNPGLAWDAPSSPSSQPSPAQPTPAPRATAMARLRPDSFFAARAKGVRPANSPEPVALTLRVDDDTYLRLKYLAQCTGRSPQQLMSMALDEHLKGRGVPAARKLVVKPQ